MKIYFKLGVSSNFQHEKTPYVLEVDNIKFINRIRMKHPDRDTWDKELFKYYAREFIIEEGLFNPRGITVEITKEDLQVGESDIISPTEPLQFE